MKKKIKIRVMTIILLAALLVGLLPASASASAAEYKTITTDEIKKKMDDYINYLNLSEECKVFWDQCLRSSEEQARLVNALDEYARTGNKELLKVGLTNTPCPLTAKTGKHRYETGGCRSNIFNGGAQCHGFGLYFAYYLHNAFINGGNAYDKWTKNNASWESIGGLKPGDFLRVKVAEGVFHTMVFYGVDSNGLIKVVHGNGHSSSKPCSVNFENPWYTNNSKYSETLCRQLFESGRLTITRYKYIVDCNHAYEFKNDTVRCTCCGEEYPLTHTPVNAYMDVIAVNKSSGSAPAHNNPYGDSAIERRYYMGDTLYVVSVCRNAYNNAWYQLSSGLYVNEDYLGTHTHNAPSNCFCTKCAKDLEVVAMDVTLPVKNNSLLAHFAPYGESADYTINAESVKVTGKVVNKYNNIFYRLSDGSYTYTEYLDVSTAVGYVNISYDKLALNEKPASSASGKSRMLAELQPYSFMTVYPAESTGSWYSVSANVNGRVVCGYVYKKYVTIMETTKEIGGTNVSNTGTTSGTVTNLAAKPTPTPTPTPVPKAKVLAPTNRNYTKKQYVGYTNAVLVSNIRKDAGTSVSAVGIDLFDAYGNLIKTYEENVVGVVGKNNTNFHSWFDVNKELRVNLSRRTTYNYRFYTIVEGQRYEGQMYSFTTK